MGIMKNEIMRWRFNQRLVKGMLISYKVYFGSGLIGFDFQQ